MFGHLTISRISVFGLLLACSTPFISSASAAEALTVEVVINDVAKTKGEIYVAICGETEFGKGCTHSKAVKAERGAVSVKFEGLDAGTYGVMAYHDENSNQQLDRTDIGIPTEGYGFSGTPNRFGPPNFAQAAVDLSSAQNVVSIQLVY